VYGSVGFCGGWVLPVFCYYINFIYTCSCKTKTTVLGDVNTREKGSEHGKSAKKHDDWAVWADSRGPNSEADGGVPTQSDDLESK
jgi:hypothetical protein